MKKLKIMLLIFVAVFVCSALLGCPSNKSKFNGFVIDTRQQVNNLLNKIDQEINIDEDEYIFNTNVNDNNTRLYYNIYNKYVLSCSKAIGNEYLDFYFSGPISQGTVLQSEIDDLKEICKLDYAISFAIHFANPYLESKNGEQSETEELSPDFTHAGYNILVFKTKDSAKYFNEYLKINAPNTVTILDNNELLMTVADFYDYSDKITKEKINQVFSEAANILKSN